MTEEPTSVFVCGGGQFVKGKKDGGIKVGPNIWKIRPDPCVPPEAQTP